MCSTGRRQHAVAGTGQHSDLLEVSTDAEDTTENPPSVRRSRRCYWGHSWLTRNSRLSSLWSSIREKTCHWGKTPSASNFSVSDRLKTAKNVHFNSERWALAFMDQTWRAKQLWFLLFAQSAGMCIFIVDTFILLFTVTSVFAVVFLCETIKVLKIWSWKGRMWWMICARKDDALRSDLLVGGGRRVSLCASWDRNRRHNQLELRITAALWVPLQSHPPKSASFLGGSHLVRTAGS